VPRAHDPLDPDTVTLLENGGEFFGEGVKHSSRQRPWILKAG
jgi:hypothetical protein